MTQKTKSAGNETPNTKVANQLKTLRAQIDKLDLQILELVNKRAAVAAEIGKLKADNSTEVFAPAREEEVLNNVLDHHRGPLDPQTVRAIFRELIGGSRALQKVLKVAYLGPEYSYSHLAAIERFSQSVEFQRVGSIAAVFEAVDRRQADYGVVPLENSTDGRISDTLDMFLRIPVDICAEIRMKIHLHLLAVCDQEKIRRVYSKPQALAQCRNWLAKNVPQATLVEVASTTTAAELASKEAGAAAVASRQAAIQYKLRILCSDIEDDPHNETRFAVIGHHKPARTGNDKTALMFKVNHAPGTLVEALDVFKQAKINLTWIESFPSRAATPSGKPEYVFFVDFEGHIEDPKVEKALKGLATHCKEVKILGSFPRSEEPV